MPETIESSATSGTTGQPAGSPPAGGATPGATPSPPATATGQPPAGQGQTPTPSTPPSDGDKPKGDAPPAPAEGAKDPAGDAPKDGDKAEKPRDASGKFAPDYSKLTFPEGFAPDEQALGQARELFGKHKLPLEAAQEFATFYAAQQRAQAEAWAAQSEKWAAQVKADPELGQTAAMSLVAKGRDAFASPALVQFFDGLGIGNHPEVVRLFRDLGRSVAEDRLVTPGSVTARDLASTLYPNTPGMRP